MADRGAVAAPATPLFSVVIAVRNGAHFLPGLFARLDAQDLEGGAFETILVDDQSTDQTWQVASDWVRLDPSRRRLLEGPARGPAAARNVGIDAAGGEWVAFTDCDTLPASDWLSSAAGLITTTGASAVEGAVLNDGGGPPDFFSRGLETLGGGRYMTANMFYRRSALVTLGGFCELFTGAYMEDTDLAFRFMDLGHEIPFAAEAVVYHRILPAPALTFLRNGSKVRWLALVARRHPVRYWSQLRPVNRPLNRLEVEGMMGLASALAATRVRGLPRLGLVALAALGLRHSFAAAADQSALPLPRRAQVMALLLARPFVQSFWWVEGCVQFRKWIY